MKVQAYWIVYLFVLAFSTACGTGDKKQVQQDIEGSESWVQIFNGKDLQGWNAKIKGHPLGENFKNTFRVEDGILKVDYSEYKIFDNRFGHLFYQTPYSHYRFKMKYRFTGEQVNGGEGWATKNSGVMIHCQVPGTMKQDQNFPVCVEVQLLGGLEEGTERPTANVCTPGTHIYMEEILTTEHCIPSSSKTFYGEEWVELELLVMGDSLIEHRVNGELVMVYAKPVYGGEYSEFPEKEGKPVMNGYIALQSESHPVEFKEIELLDLSER